MVQQSMTEVPIQSGVSRSSFAIWRTVLFALLLREVKTRFGKYRLGYLWIFLEPALHVGMLTLAFMTVRSRKTFYDLEAPVFVVMGIVPFLLLRHGIRRSVTAIDANQRLFCYRQVKPIDAIVVRVMLEALIYSVAFFVLLAICWWFGMNVHVDDPLALVEAFGLMFLLALGLGLCLGVLGALYAETQQLMQGVMRPMYFLSGVFYTIDMVPPTFQPYLLWNPIFHVLDLIRGAMIRTYDSPASPAYVFFVALGLVLFGLMYYRRRIDRILLS